jgi:hypothetical protein
MGTVVDDARKAVEEVSWKSVILRGTRTRRVLCGRTKELTGRERREPVWEQRI